MALILFHFIDLFHLSNISLHSIECFITHTISNHDYKLLLYFVKEFSP